MRYCKKTNNQTIYKKILFTTGKNGSILQIINFWKGQGRMIYDNTHNDGLYNPQFEHDNCGIGAIVNIKGIKTHKTVENALSIVENLEHRAGKDAEGKTGDGVGIMLQISHKFFSKACKQLGIDIGGEREYGVGMFFFQRTS